MNTRTRTTIGLAASLVVAAVLALLAPAAAHAQTLSSCEAAITDYEGSALITIDPVTVTPGGTVTLTGTGFPPNSFIPLYFNDAEIGQATADDTGSFTFTYTVPSDVTSGSFEFSAACGTFILTAQITITPVSPPTVPPVTQPLPVTGSDSGRVAQVALTLLALGGVLVVTTRRQAKRRALVGS